MITGRLRRASWPVLPLSLPCILSAKRQSLLAEPSLSLSNLDMVGACPTLASYRSFVLDIMTSWTYRQIAVESYDFSAFTVFTRSIHVSLWISSHRDNRSSEWDLKLLLLFSHVLFDSAFASLPNSASMWWIQYDVARDYI